MLATETIFKARTYSMLQAIISSSWSVGEVNCTNVSSVGGVNPAVGYIES